MSGEILAVLGWTTVITIVIFAFAILLTRVLFWIDQRWFQ